jgi:hypothetical protein
VADARQIFATLVDREGRPSSVLRPRLWAGIGFKGKVKSVRRIEGSNSGAQSHADGHSRRHPADPHFRWA